MRTTSKPLLARTASDLMTCDVVLLPAEMPLRDAIRLLLQKQVSGAPVVDAQGKCVGVLSALDILRLAGKREDVTRPAGPALPITCPFVVKRKDSDGKEMFLCTLLPGVCPIQVRQKGADGKEMIVCSQPHCVLVDWQLVEVEKLPTDEVRLFMTADPVTVSADTPIRTLARLMIDAYIRRLIIVEERRRPVGIVSSTDILAAVAYAEERA
jgi:CBS domain-containing protein